MSTNKKFFLWLACIIFALVSVCVFTSYNQHFWKPRALIFNLSSALNNLRIIVDHFCSAKSLISSTTIIKMHMIYLRCSLEISSKLFALLSFILSTSYLFCYIKVNYQTIRPHHTSELIVYKKYFIQNSRAIIPLP